MDGIEKITARINADMDQEIAQIKAAAQKQSDDILADAQAQAQRQSEDILAKGRKAAQERQERLESAAKMETRKLTLAAKQEVLGEAFDQALKKLCSLGDEDYIALLTKLAVKASTTGKEKLIFSKKDRSRIGKQVVVAANEALTKGRTSETPSAASDSKVKAFLGKVVNNAAAAVTGASLTLSEETRNIKGGFIMVDGDVEINCTFETLVRLQRETLERDVAHTLFD
jgi:V/A-type H+-transporting ATPase subunit E